MDTEDLQASVHNRLLNLRNIERLVAEESFSRAFGKATDDQRFEIFLAIDAENVDWLRSVIRGVLKIDLTLRDLREKAAELGVRQYSRLTKEELQIAIRTKELQRGSKSC